MKKQLFLILSTCMSVLSVFGQQSTSEDIQRSYDKRKTLAESSLLKEYPVSNIGPVVQGGRITDFAVNHNDTKEFYVAYASGGIFKTTNNGNSFEPIFDNQGALTIGDIALAPSDQKILYVGTGEKNSSRSSYAGNGIYKTKDGGKTWEHLGLKGSQHISRILVHPKNPEVVWVAVIGALYSTSEERGLFKSKDGGATWEKTLFINDNTGVIDLVMNPSNPNELFATTWDRSRRAWDFQGNGEGSAIYRSQDAGHTWKKITDGFPEGAHVGRIGIDISKQNPKVLYALLDNQFESKQEKEEQKVAGLGFSDFKTMSTADFAKIEDKKLQSFLKEMGFPERFTAERVKREVANGKYSPAALSDYFGDANNNLFDTKVTGAELYRSADSGDHWEKVNSYALDGVYFTYGYYFGEVRIDPTNDQNIYVFGVPLLKSVDGGKTFARANDYNVHSDHQALWINPSDSQHLRLGNDGGYYESYDQGESWNHINNTSVGQFYTVNYDMETPYNVYGGLQDNGVLTGSSTSVPNVTPHWERLFGGDGMFVAPDPRDNQLVYTGFQFGNYYRIDRKNKKYKFITPNHDIGQDKLRYNWRTPLIMSPHNPDILYIAAQSVFRSVDQGNSWENISEDLSKNKPQGNVPFSTVSSLAESPLKFGLLYAGTDDGNVHVTQNGGANWTNITNGLPDGKWVSSVYASKIDEATVYITLNGYRQDDFKSYVYKSEDFGKNWKSIKGNLPEVVMNVVQEDPDKKGLLYLGTDHGTYISMQDGASWELLNPIGNVASYDIKVQPEAKHLIVATHGRGIFIVRLAHMHQVYEQQNATILTFGKSKIRSSNMWGKSRYDYMPKNEPKLSIPYYVNTNERSVRVEIKNEKGQLVFKEQLEDIENGFNQFIWNVKGAVAVKSKKKNQPQPQQTYCSKGTYEIVFYTSASKASSTIEIK